MLLGPNIPLRDRALSELQTTGMMRATPLVFVALLAVSAVSGELQPQAHTQTGRLARSPVRLNVVTRLAFGGYRKLWLVGAQATAAFTPVLRAQVSVARTQLGGTNLFCSSSMRAKWQLVASCAGVVPAAPSIDQVPCRCIWSGHSQAFGGQQWPTTWHAPPIYQDGSQLASPHIRPFLSPVTHIRCCVTPQARV